MERITAPGELTIRRHQYRRRMARPRVIERRMSKFLREPASVRNAVNVIVVVTLLLVVVGGVLMRVLDHAVFPNIWLGMWWALQTVTTVGYGDVVPKSVGGRIVGAAAMLQGIALLTIITAGITSTFVARAQRERLPEGATADAHRDTEAIHRRFDDLDLRLDRLEQAVRDRPER
jgi:voltage-gated potassium channel